MIEFSTPEASVATAARAAAKGCAHVVGTTGLDGEQTQALARSAERVPIVWAPNMSQGVNLLLGLVERVARTLDPAFDIENPGDAPPAQGGRALRHRAGAGPGRRPRPQRGARGRGRAGARRHHRPRSAGSIGFATLRGGDVVGEHRVIFAGAGERLELTHVATDRRIYARGAVLAALWTAGRPPGLYGMDDVLGIS